MKVPVLFYCSFVNMSHYHLCKSTKSSKKLMITTPSGKTIHFGAKGYSDYTLHRDPDRKRAYDARHRVNENWKVPNSAGFFAKWILWNKQTLEESIKDTERRFRIKIIRSPGLRCTRNNNRFGEEEESENSSWSSCSCSSCSFSDDY